MPNQVYVKISELPVAGTVADTDQLEANQGGTTRSVTVAQLIAAAAGADLSDYAPINAPVFTGDPQRQTPPPPGDSDSSIPTTAWVQAEIDASIGAIPAVSWDAITGKPVTFPPMAHGHVISDVTGLQPALDGKAPTSHTHPASAITDFSEAVDDRVAGLLVAGSNVTLAYNDTANTLTIGATGGGGGGGTVTSTSVVSSNGLAGTVATPTTTPAITLSTTITGMVKGNGTALSAATAGTDYVAPSALSGYLPLTGGTLTGPVLSDLATAPNQSAYRVTNYSLTGTNTAGAFRIDGTLNVSSGIQPDVFSINLADISNQGGSAFVIKAGPTAGNTIMRCDMAGDLQTSGWAQCMSGLGLPTGGAYYFAYYIGNGVGGNLGMYAGLGAPASLDTFGRFGSIYLNAASPGIPYYNNNGSTGWDRLVGETSTQTLTNKTITGYATTASIPTTLPPSGAAGGALTGTYPNPTLVGGPLSNYLTTATAATTYAPINAPVFTGDARAVTPTAGDNDTSIATTAFVTAAVAAATSGSALPPGAIMDFAGAAAPTGWLLCNGQSVSTTTYAALFTAIGYLYGGSGASFNVPDLGGRVTAGKEATATRLTTAGAGINGSVLGAAGGVQTYALDATMTAAHSHSLTDHSHNGIGGSALLYGNAGTAFGTTVSGGNYVGYSSTTGGITGATNTGSSGSGVAHQNTQPTMIMNKIIKT